MSHTRDHSVTRSLEWKLPLLISGLVLGVVLLYCWAAYREMRSSSVSAATEHLGEAAIELEVSPATLRNWDRAGKLTAHRHPINGYRLYRAAEVLALKQRIQGKKS